MIWFKKEIRYAARSPGWNKIRKEHLKNHPNCAACGKSNKVEVHHIKPVHIDPANELSLDNLITLCDSPCHITFGHLMDYKSWNTDVVEDCQKYLQKIKDKP